MKALDASLVSRYSVQTPLELEAQVGHGGFGRVYRAHHKRLDIPVAVKVLHSHLVDAQALRMFQREARLMARLDHTHLLRVFDYQVGPEGPMMITEWMDGGALRSPVRDEAELLDVAVAAASALQALHAAGVLHRDVKPDNLMKRGDGRVKLGDLGIALDPHQTQGDQVIGSFAYMPPEIFERDKPAYGPSSDLYALGVTLYELWTGSLPFGGRTMWSLIENICRGKAPPASEVRPGLSAETSALIEVLMARDPEDRVSAQTVLTEVATAQTAQPVSVAPEESSEVEPLDGLKRVGPWVLTGVVYRSRNWTRYEAHHRETGVAGRFSHLNAGSPLPEALILESARRASMWSHAGLVPVLDWGRHQGRAFIVVAPAGRPMTSIIDARGPYGEVEGLRLLKDLASAVAFLHEQGVVYQMVEPGSVYQRATGQGATLAWPCWTCPVGEPVEGRRVFVFNHVDLALEDSDVFVTSTDVYGLGAVLVTALTGQSVRTFGLDEALFEELRVAAPGITAPTAELAMRLTLRDTSKRIQTAQGVVARCERILSRLTSP